MKLITSFARNRVFANLAMALIMIAGLLAWAVMIREEIPGMTMDTIVVTVTYDGADPQEIEEGISRKIEDVIDGLEGVDSYISTSFEGRSETSITVSDGYDADLLLDRVRNEVDSISTFPADADRPSIVRPVDQDVVMTLGLLSDMDDARLKEWAETIRKELKHQAGVNQVTLTGTRAYEISVEISQDILHKYNLTIGAVADIIAEESQNRFGGTMRTSAEDIRLRTLGRRYTGRELAGIKVISGLNGQTLHLGDLADIRDGFTQNDLSIRANGRPAVMLNILSGEVDTIKMADRVSRFMAEKNKVLPPGTEIIVLTDDTEDIRSVLERLYANAGLGLVFVLILLWLFMDTRIAFWAGMGIPVSLLGGLAIVYLCGYTLNKVTLFGLIMVLGIVADDAIIVGEAIFYHRRTGAPALDAVIKGVSEVGLAVLVAIATTIAAFFPLYHIEGVLGKFIAPLPTAVIACLLISLLECLFILPAHLSDLPEYSGRPQRNGLLNVLDGFHKRTMAAMDIAGTRIYLPVLKACVRFRYIFVCLCISLVFICIGLVNGGFVKFKLFPKRAASVVTASVTFPEGTPFHITRKAVERLEASAMAAAASFDTLSGRPLVENRLATVGQWAGEDEEQAVSAAPNRGGVSITLASPAKSGVHSDAFITAWENACGPVAGVQSLTFDASDAGPPGSAIEISLQGNNLDQLSLAARKIIDALESVDGVSQVRSDNAPGKNELKLRLRPEARYLGLNTGELALRIQHAFYGALAMKVQRDNDEVDVFVRLTEAQRGNRRTLSEYLIKIDENTWIPLTAVADIEFGPGPSAIIRKNGFRQIMISADVDTAEIVAGDVIQSLSKGIFKEISSRYPDVDIVLYGDAEQSSETFGSIALWGPVSVMIIFVMIAAMFRSYVQPFLILLTLPFGIVGAVWGHLVMGKMLSVLSVFGMVALAGVVVNDAIVLIERINMNLARGTGFFDSVFQGGLRRFRAVMLTSVSTVGGLLPLILDKSQQAQQLIPMGISLAFGVAFATVLTLVLLPCLLVIVNDIRFVFAGGLGPGKVFRNRLEPAFHRVAPETEPSAPAAGAGPGSGKGFPVSCP